VTHGFEQDRDQRRENGGGRVGGTRKRDQIVSRGKCKFRQSDVTRAAKAAREAGAEGLEIDPGTGKFRIILGGAAPPDNETKKNADQEYWRKAIEKLTTQ